MSQSLVAETKIEAFVQPGNDLIIGTTKAVEGACEGDLDKVGTQSLRAAEGGAEIAATVGTAGTATAAAKAAKATSKIAKAARAYKKMQKARNIAMETKDLAEAI